jgi:hypothetical protein
MPAARARGVLRFVRLKVARRSVFQSVAHYWFAVAIVLDSAK